MLRPGWPFYYVRIWISSIIGRYIDVILVLIPRPVPPQLSNCQYRCVIQDLDMILIFIVVLVSVVMVTVVDAVVG